MVGISVYVNEYSEEYLRECRELGISKVFTSLHIPEEIDDSFLLRAKQLITLLSELDFEIIADISSYTINNLGIDFLYTSKVKSLRIDYGLSDEQIVMLGNKFELVLNASTLAEDDVVALIEKGVDCSKIKLMHNFYPKSETGLGMEQLQQTNLWASKYNLEVSGFIPGDQKLRGPIKEALPTVEKHRKVKPYAAYLELASVLHDIYIGDIEISLEQLNYILLAEQGVIIIPVEQLTNQKYLNCNLSIRIDSGPKLLRIKESRDYAQQGELIDPKLVVARKRGDITIDNDLFKRYSGEVCIVLENLPLDERVNKLGQISREYLSIIDFLVPGHKIKLSMI